MSVPARGSDPHTHFAKLALTISLVSLVWTLVAGSAAIGIGLSTKSLVLVAFGGIGLLDAVGSASLVIHFRHSLHHEAPSDHLEKVALRIIAVGMALIGISTGTISVYRLTRTSSSSANWYGVALAAVSIGVLGGLSIFKSRLARQLRSRALQSDGWVSLMGALLAAITVAGIGIEAALGWRWVDSLAALCVASGAVVLSVVAVRTEHDWQPDDEDTT